MNWKVPYLDLSAQYLSIKEEIDEAVGRVLASGKYTSGPETEKFECSMEAYLGVRHVVSCGNGYDALFMALTALGIGLESRVMTGSYTHISTHSSVLAVGAELLIDKGDSPIHAVIPIHMNGRMQQMDFYGEVPIIEDACQAIGASYEGKKAGTFGIMGCFSLHPMKVLGCAGDGGFIATDSTELQNKLRAMRNHGGGFGYGVNSRLDNIQAAILNVKLPYLTRWIERRREIAAHYEKLLPEWVKKPPPPSEGPYFDTYSSYVIGGSPALLKHLQGKGIECFSHIRKDVVSLPIYPEMKDGHIAMVCAAFKGYEHG